MYFLFAFNLRLTTCIQIDKKKRHLSNQMNMRQMNIQINMHYLDWYCTSVVGI